ncbi:MAG: L,D-transpeptidase family protein [Bacteroidetes bacterium]|nr:L,D-transpeptidase family protein [Bacteroidota bacterium]
MIILFLLHFAISLASAQNFISEQKKYSRVKAPFAKPHKSLISKLSELNIKESKMEVFIRVLKQEEILEIYVRNKGEVTFKLFEKVDVCASSGTVGYKLKQGDRQTPEGHYRINLFNHQSNFHLSLKINYPNHEDKQRSKGLNAGGDIFIHGECVTIGCVPLGNEGIELLYMMCVITKNNGQQNIPVHIYPCYMNTDAYSKLKSTYKGNKNYINFWNQLEGSYFQFEKNKTL